MAQARGYTVTHVYRERRSSFKERPAHKALMADAAMRRFDVVLSWSLDRFGRSLVELLSCVERLDERGVKFVSLREPAIDTTTAAGKLILMVLGAAAEFERNRLRESHSQARDLDRVMEFVALNREVLLRHWNDDQYSGKKLLEDVRHDPSGRCVSRRTG